MTDAARTLLIAALDKMLDRVALPADLTEAEAARLAGSAHIMVSSSLRSLRRVECGKPGVFDHNGKPVVGIVYGYTDSAEEALMVVPLAKSKAGYTQYAVMVEHVKPAAAGPEVDAAMVANEKRRAAFQARNAPRLAAAKAEVDRALGRK